MSFVGYPKVIPSPSLNTLGSFVLELCSDITVKNALTDSVTFQPQNHTISRISQDLFFESCSGQKTDKLTYSNHNGENITILNTHLPTNSNQQILKLTNRNKTTQDVNFPVRK